MLCRRLSRIKTAHSTIGVRCFTPGVMAHRDSDPQPLTESDEPFFYGTFTEPGSLYDPCGDLDSLDPLASHVGCSWDPNLPAQDAVGLIESYTLPSTRLAIGSYPVASGAVADTYEGTLDGRKVCVKRYRCYSRRDPRGAQEVRHPFLPSPLRILKGT